MANLMPFDEINALESNIRKKKQLDADELEDEVLDLLILAYLMGEKQARTDLFGEEEELDDIDEMRDAEQRTDSLDTSPDDMLRVIFQPVADRTFAERIREYAESDDADSIDRVIETDAHRVYETAAFETAVRLGATKKTWHHMNDDRVRDPHWVLGGVTVPIDGLFWTDGSSAPRPMAFGVPELDINCRCFLSYGF